MFLTVIFNLIIRPLIVVFELIYSLMDKFLGNPILCIVALSIVMNLLCLPLYKRADAIQEEERQKQESMAYWLNHIKKAFKGDERYMMINTYYRQQNYKPISALRSSMSLILQIPFFIAAYQYLSHLSLLKGASFWIFNDLGSPDHMFYIGSLPINILPIIMTIFNVVSSYIYLKGFPMSQKIQTYGLALVFLVLLYNSPSGLVIYWTCNQIFSLIKNIFLKLIPNKKVLGICLSVLGIAVCVSLFASGVVDSGKKILFVIVIFLVCQIPLVSAFVKKQEQNEKEVLPVPKKIYVLCAVFLTLFIGMIIPLTVISSSPTEFVTAGSTPAQIIVYTASLAAGFFIVWFSVFYYLASQKGKNVISYAMFAITGASIVDFIFFGKNLGFISESLVYDTTPSFSFTQKLINLLIVILVMVAFILLLKYCRKIMPYVLIVLLVGSIGLMITHIRSINKQLKDSIKNEIIMANEAEPVFRLSKTGNNVVFLMLDRGMSGYIPYILAEKPELAEKLDGFTYYPNTLTYGPVTYIAAPALFGGYDYTPAKINERDDVLLGDKHNEALSIMPYNFSENGYEVTVADLPFAGGQYGLAYDYSFLDDYENVKAVDLSGKYYVDKNEEFDKFSSDRQNRNFFYYSVMKVLPLWAQNTLYDGGNYYSTETKLASTSKFLTEYAVMDALPELTEITEENVNTCMIMENAITHSPSVTDTETYEPAAVEHREIYGDMDRFTLNGITVRMEEERQVMHYNANMAAWIKIGEWIDYLKEEGVYDNTKIIIASDHGYDLYQFDYMQISSLFNCQKQNALLLVKDFDAHGWTQCDDFMTTADAPLLAFEGTVKQPINPFNGSVLTDEEKYAHPQWITTSGTYSKDQIRKDTVMGNNSGSWWSVHDNIFDKNNWTLEKSN
ncbi:MAG: YidC/Oxa1 family membrane protein insertase [Lachnospiraceae bacterium]|nr:YidC/Oxa1 family membrane protein insertase [Lachnospiraceae bacterium]